MVARRTTAISIPATSASNAAAVSAPSANTAIRPGTARVIVILDTRGRNGSEDLRQQIVRRPSLEQRVGSQGDAMAQRRQGDALDVVRRRIVAAVERGHGARAT